MKNIDRYMRYERKECSEQGWRDRCQLTVAMLTTGAYRARLSFQPGMESTFADGATVEAALQALDELLKGES